MKRSALGYALSFCIVLLSLTASAGNVETAGKYIEERHKDWGNLALAEKELSEVLKDEPANVRANILMARVYLFKGDKAEGTDNKIRIYEEGAEFAKTAVKADPNSPDAHFFYGANIGRTAELKGIFNALGIAAEVKKELDKTVELDPGHALGLNALAVYYMEMPGLFGGCIEKCEGLLFKAKESDPNLSMTYVNLGKLYIKLGKRDLAKAALETVINMKNPSKPAFYALDDKPDAEKLLKDLN
jgi:Tfp pilus assembly protein PilF